MAIYFLTEGGTPVPSEYRCLFCECVFDKRSVLSVHYLDVHPSAFSAEELVKAAARRAHDIASRGNWQDIDRMQKL